MICIKSIQIVEVDEDRLEVTHFQKAKGRTIQFVEDMHKTEEQKVTREMVVGRIFVNAYGKRLCIGMTKRAQDAIGLPFEVFEDQGILIERQQNTIFAEGREIRLLNKRIDRIRELTFLDRLKYLFKGYGEEF